MRPTSAARLRFLATAEAIARQRRTPGLDQPPTFPGPPDDIATTWTPFGRWLWRPGPPNRPAAGDWIGPTPTGTHDAYQHGDRIYLVKRRAA